MMTTPRPFFYRPYKSGLHWAFYHGDELVTVTAYRKGCEGIANMIRKLAPTP